MKIKGSTIVFIITFITFVYICIFDIIENVDNMGITNNDVDITSPIVSPEITTTPELQADTSNMKLLNGRVFYSASQDNDDYIVASVDSTTEDEFLTLTRVNSHGSDTEIYDDPVIVQNELGNTKQYSSSSTTSIIQLIIQGGEATAIKLFKNGETLFVSNQYEHYDDSHITNNDKTYSNSVVPVSHPVSHPVSDPVNFFNTNHNSNYSNNYNYILKSRVVPKVNPKNPYLMDDLDNWTVYNNLLPNENDLENNEPKSISHSDKDKSLLSQIKSLITKFKSDKNNDNNDDNNDDDNDDDDTPKKTLTKYEEVYRKTHGIPKHEQKNDNVRCPPCAPCGRCPDAAFQCKYSPSNGELPRAVINSFSTFGM